jgi:L-asparaginase
MMDKKLIFIGMGGTIAGKAARSEAHVAYQSGAIGLPELLENVPGLRAALGGHAFCTEQLAQMDSKDMGFAHWQLLAQRLCVWLADESVQGIVVTHGTDTLEEAAFFLSCVVPADLLRNKPVVLTCAMRPASAFTPDGPQNLLDACAVALDVASRGVVVVCAGKVHSALQVQKVHPYRLDAFDSGEAGPLALVEEGRLRWLKPASLPQPLYAFALPLESVIAWPKVEIVMSYAEAGACVVEGLVAYCSQPGRSPLVGLVVAGTGNGTVHVDLHAALQRAQSQGVRVVRTTRCAYGSVVVAQPQAGEPMDAGAFATMALPPVKARITLVLELLAKSRS